MIVPMIPRLLSTTALALTAVFLGIALYITIGEQPARLALADAALLTQWKLSVSTGIALQGSLVIAAGLLGVAAWWPERDWRWLAGGLLLLANWPWTRVMIAPINKALMATADETAGPASRALIEQWGHLHSVRALLALLAAALFVWAANRRPAARRA
jgi:hypothetical protein